MLESSGIGGFSFLIQSSVRDPFYLNSRIENFISEWNKELSTLSVSDFKIYIEATKTKLLEKPKTLSELSSKYWVQIENQYYLFNISDLVKPKLDQLTLQNLKEFSNHYLFNNHTRSKMMFQVYGTNHRQSQQNANTGSIPINNIYQFKKMSNLYPHPDTIQYLTDRKISDSTNDDCNTTPTSPNSTLPTSTLPTTSGATTSPSTSKPTSSSSTSESTSSNSKTDATFTEDETNSSESIDSTTTHDDTSGTPDSIDCGNKKYTFTDMVFVILITVLVVVFFGSVLVVILVKYFIKKAKSNDFYTLDSFDTILNKQDD